MEFICYNDLNQVPESVDSLFLIGEKESLFCSREWLENLAADLLESEQELILACVISKQGECGDKVLALLPLLKSPNNPCLTAFKHRYTSLYSVLLADLEQPQILTCLAQGLGQLPIQALLLEPVADDDRGINELQQAMESQGFECQRIFRFYNWILQLQSSSYPSYLATRPSKLRNTIARKGRKLAREHGYDIRLYCGAEVPQKMKDYHTVYRASWKANEQYQTFLDHMVVSFSQRGWSRLGVLYVKEQPVAAQLWFVVHGKASIFRLAYDENWKKYSPGSLLTDHLMESVIERDKVETVDFLTGNETYKQDWMSKRNQRWALSCVNKNKPEAGIKKMYARIKSMINPNR